MTAPKEYDSLAIDSKENEVDEISDSIQKNFKNFKRTEKQLNE